MFVDSSTDDGKGAAAAGEHVEGDGEGVVDQDVAEQDGAEEEVTHPSYRHDGLHTKFPDT